MSADRDSLDFLVKQRKFPGPNDTAKKKKKERATELSGTLSHICKTFPPWYFYPVAPVPSCHSAAIPGEGGIFKHIMFLLCRPGTFSAVTQRPCDLAQQKEIPDCSKRLSVIFLGFFYVSLSFTSLVDDCASSL